MNPKDIICAFLVTGVLFFQPRLFGETARSTLPDDPAKAWAGMEKAYHALKAPGDWRAHEPTSEQVIEFQKQVRQTAVSFAEKAREFIERFSGDENVGDARATVVGALTYAVAAGDANAERQLAAFLAKVLADEHIPEDDRALLVILGNSAFEKKVGMRLFTEGLGELGKEYETAKIESMHAALKQFPTNSMIYTMLVAAARQCG